MKIEVINAKCTGCRICVPECPVEAIAMIEGKAVIDLDTCIMCGACAKACPEGAILFEKPKKVARASSANKGVFVFCEQRKGELHPVSLELASSGRRLADRRGSKLFGVIFGEGVANLADEMIAHGADGVIVVDQPALKDFSEDSYSSALTWIIKKYSPEIVLAGATAIGRSFFPRVAAELRTGLTADCTALDIDEGGNLLQTRPAFGGNIMATILCTKTRPQMATVRSGVMGRPLRIVGRTGEVIIERPDKTVLASRIELIESIIETASGPSLTSADIIVAGGFGLKKKENFALIKELADSLGASVAASRTAVDRGFAPYSRQVGQTGKTVNPKLYIAVGISGAIQHLVGMQTAKKIVAINRDPYAPIFRVADVGLVGDLFEVVPKLIKEIKRSGVFCNYSKFQSHRNSK